MIMVGYCQILSKRLNIKIALSRLFLGVIAAGFSLCSQDAILFESSTSQVGIIAITAIVQEHQTATTTKSQTLSRSKKHYIEEQIIPLNYSDISPSKAIRLSPYNGIRAGPRTIA